MALEGLNEAQRAAASHLHGPLLVLAGPGSGKTRVVTHRIAHLIAEGVRPEEIVALTFTNKAADEMRRRVADLVGPQPVEMGTFHRFAARLLRRHARLIGLTSDYSILDPDDAHAVLKRAAKRSGLPMAHLPIDRIAGIISRAKNDLRTPESFEPRWGHPADEVARKIWPTYQRMMLECNAVDFDDLLVHVATLLVDHPDLRASLDARHRFVLVDEYQDTNAVQYCIVRGLSIDHPNLAVTGDPDQAIYGWRGASIRNILEFERDYPSARIVKLEHNYRSTGNILAAADRLIANNTRRKAKRLVTEAEPGEKIRIVLDSTSHDEAERIADEIAEAVRGGRRVLRDYCVLFRTNALSRSLEVALRSRGIPYQLVRGLEFFKRREIKDVLAWLRMLRNPRDDEAFLRVVNVPPRGVGKQSLDLLGAWSAERGISLLEGAAAAASCPGLSKRAQAALLKFAGLFDGLAADARGSVATLVAAVLDRTGYREMLESDDEEEGQDRIANVEELITVARDVDEAIAESGSPGEEDALGSFLERTALVADTDDWDAAADRVSLMTLHAAKGLEFKVVYLVALEEGICPHERSVDHPDQLEEERRLVFVGITRGREEVHASCARIRDYRGQRRINAPSLFLTELVGEETVLEGPEAPSTTPPPRLAGWPPRSGWDDTSQVDPTAEEEPSHAPVDFAVEESATRGRRPRAFDGDRPHAAAAAAFTEGQRVRHAEYGEGVIERIGGTGAKAIGTIHFDGDEIRRTFILAHAPLERL